MTSKNRMIMTTATANDLMAKLARSQNSCTKLLRNATKTWFSRKNAATFFRTEDDMIRMILLLLLLKLFLLLSLLHLLLFLISITKLLMIMIMTMIKPAQTAWKVTKQTTLHVSSAIFPISSPSFIICQETQLWISKLATAILSRLFGSINSSGKLVAFFSVLIYFLFWFWSLRIREGIGKEPIRKRSAFVKDEGHLCIEFTLSQNDQSPCNNMLSVFILLLFIVWLLFISH